MMVGQPVLTAPNSAQAAVMRRSGSLAISNISTRQEMRGWELITDAVNV